MSSGDSKKEIRSLTSAEIVDVIIEKSEGKAKGSVLNLLMLGFLAGVFIGFAAEGSTMASFNLLANPETYGLGRALAGAVFSTGLMLVLIAGGELFTGNTLMIAGVCEKRIGLVAMLRNWGLVYFGNFLGSVFLAILMTNTNLFNNGAGVLGAVAVKIAVGKVGLSFLEALILGILCNWLVCLAVFMCYGAETILGKIWAIFFPIWIFIISGFEHSVANMYYIPAGIFLKTKGEFAALTGLSSQALDSLNWTSFFVNNLIPVTIGNIIGGSFFVGFFYWVIYKKKS